MSRRLWEEDEVALLREYSRTHTMQEAANLLGRSLGTIREKASTLRISFRRYGEAHHKAKLSASDIKEVFTLRNNGWTNRQLAERFGVHEVYMERITNYDSRYRDSLALLASE